MAPPPAHTWPSAWAGRWMSDAGRVERAPERWQKLGLEWLYRLKKEPKRIGRMARLPLFLIGAVGTRIRGRQH